MPAFLRRLRARIKYWNHEREVAREIEVHRAMAEAALSGRGDSERDARWKAAQLLGNTTIAREDSRAMWIPIYLQQLMQDARYAVRAFRREAGFTAAAVAMLSLGLGLTTGGFALVNGLFFQGWPLPENGDLFRVQPVFQTTAGRVDDGLSLGAYRHIATSARGAEYAAFSTSFVRVSTTRDDRPTRYVPTGAYVSDNFFAAMRVPLQFGTPPLSVAQSTVPTVVISYGTWQSIFGADPAVLGKTAWLAGKPATIVGVTAPQFTGLDRPVAVYAPLWAAAELSAQSSIREAVANDPLCCVSVVGRARPSVSRAAILSELTSLTTQYRTSIGLSALTLNLPDTSIGTAVMQRGNLAAILTLFAAGAVALLLLTGANVGNLYLARSLRRQQEIVTRLALGASRARIVRQLLTEGLALSALAGILSFVAAASVPAIAHLAGEELPPTVFAADWRAALFNAVVVLAMSLGVSLAPALRTTAVVWRGGAAMATARAGGLRSALLATQIAIATALILSAVLITRGIQHGTTAPTDFALRTTTAATIDWPRDAVPTSEQRQAFRADLDAAIAASALPIGLATHMPASSRAAINTTVRTPDSNIDFSTQLAPMNSAAASVLQIRLTSGRWASDVEAVHESVVNETLAKQVWPNQSAIGRTLRLGFDSAIYTVVGVTADTHILSPSAVPATMHIAPLDSTPVLLTASSSATESAVRTMLKTLAPNAQVNFIPLSDSIRGTMAQAMGGAAIAGGLGLAALLLAMIGVYSVFSYLVEERRREIGIRVALGADRAQVRAAMFRSTRSAIAGGLGAGLLLSAIASIALRSFLFGMSPADPVSYLVVAVTLLGTALVATFVPIRRALRVNPAVTLRAD